MTREAVLLDEALARLAETGYPISSAEKFVPDAPGLYAIHAPSEAWNVLELEQRDAVVPLYVGKAEESLLDRDLKTHFAIGPSAAAKTGSSTVRRSFAALLRQTLDLHARPRNLNRPERFAN